MVGLDPRLGSVLADPRVSLGRPALKALRRGRIPLTAPTAGQVEAERPFWGPHPDPEIASIEDQFWSVGETFLRGLLSHALGRHVRSIQKAFRPKPPEVPGWGSIADLFRSDLDPERLMGGWQSVIDRLVAALLPPDTKEQAAQALALRASLLHRAGERVAHPDRFPIWGLALREAPSATVSQAMQWTKIRAVEHMTNLEAEARHALLSTLVESREAGDGLGKLQQRLFDGFSGLNRDWRRVALTESALAVSNGALASVDPAEGWLAEWKAIKNACPFCRAMSGRRFRVVAEDAAQKDGETQVWCGKSNFGRSAHRWSRKEQRTRTRDEMWWPTIPAHPNCGCTWVLRRAR